MTSVYLSTDPQADELLAHDRFALLVGMLLDQQVTMESAFAGPQKLVERLDEFTPASVAAMEPDTLLEAFREKPAVHRYPGSMATRAQALAQALVDDYEGEAQNLWSAPMKDGSAPTGRDVLRRLKALPGYGEQKAKIFLALLGKQFDLTVDGWREAAGDFGPDDAFLSIADVRDEDSLFRVRENKKTMKAAAKAARSAKKG